MNKLVTRQKDKKEERWVGGREMKTITTEIVVDQLNKVWTWKFFSSGKYQENFNVKRKEKRKICKLYITNGEK